MRIAINTSVYGADGIMKENVPFNGFTHLLTIEHVIDFSFHFRTQTKSEFNPNDSKEVETSYRQIDNRQSTRNGWVYHLISHFVEFVYTLDFTMSCSAKRTFFSSLQSKIAEPYVASRRKLCHKKISIDSESIRFYDTDNLMTNE